MPTSTQMGELATFTTGAASRNANKDSTMRSSTAQPPNPQSQSDEWFQALQPIPHPFRHSFLNHALSQAVSHTCTGFALVMPWSVSLRNDRIERPPPIPLSVVHH